MTERERDTAFEVDAEGRVVRNPIDTIGAVPGEEFPADISGGPGEGTGWGAWRAEHAADNKKSAKQANANAGAATGKRRKRD